MGKFINTQYSGAVDSLTDFHKDLLDQDFYQFTSNGQKPVKCTYYNLNKQESTLDPGSKLIYSEMGEDSPLRFDRIKNLYIYGMPRLEINLENGEFGMESSDLTGESYILPYQFTPTDNDFFSIFHIGKPWLFRVTDASMAMLKDGTQAWKINWELDRTTDREILNNIVKDFTFIEATPGTTTKRIIQDDNLELAKDVDNTAESVRNYFNDLFYSEKVQTYIYKFYTESNMYDPYAIEFIIRNKLMQASGSDYVYVEHQAPTNPHFAITYDRSIFKAFEMKDKEKFREYYYQAQADFINDPRTIFSTRYEEYFMLNYNVVHEPNGPLNPRRIIPIIEEELIDRIEREAYYNEQEEYDRLYLNIIIKYFNNRDIKPEDYKYFDSLDYTPTYQLFYYLLFILFVLDYYTNKLLN